MVDEIIFRTANPRNRLMLELMARGGMRIGEVLKLTPNDTEDRKAFIREPKSGKRAEVVFLPHKVSDRLQQYIREKGISPDERIISIGYGTARVIVKKAGEMVDVRLRPHDLRRHAENLCVPRRHSPGNCQQGDPAALESANDPALSGKGERRRGNALDR